MKSEGGAWRPERYHLPTSSFGLTKWYVDCVDDRGASCIAYWALLRWKTLSLSYSAVLVDGKTYEHLFSVDAPNLDGDVLTWRAEPLECDVLLRRRAPRYATKLYESKSGCVMWRCEMPAADAHFRVAGRDLRGAGYAEVLEMTIPPWQLPIEELRWGRYCGEQSVVWIDWRGPHPLTIVLLNGTPVSGHVDDAIRASDLTLSMNGSSVIRSATLSETLASMGLLAKLVPGRILRASEKKWASRATLCHNGDVVDRGWAIHEVVRFA